MRTFSIAAMAILGLASWQVIGAGRMDANNPVRTAYEDSIRRYQGGETVQRAASPQRAQPLAEDATTGRVENAHVV